MFMELLILAYLTEGSPKPPVEDKKAGIALLDERSYRIRHGVRGLSSASIAQKNT